jgi:hypothetical protein
VRAAADQRLSKGPTSRKRREKWGTRQQRLVKSQFLTNLRSKAELPLGLKPIFFAALAAPFCRFRSLRAS